MPFEIYPSNIDLLLKTMTISKAIVPFEIYPSNIDLLLKTMTISKAKGVPRWSMCVREAGNFSSFLEERALTQVHVQLLPIERADYGGQKVGLFEGGRTTPVWKVPRRQPTCVCILVRTTQRGFVTMSVRAPAAIAGSTWWSSPVIRLEASFNRSYA